MLYAVQRHDDCKCDCASGSKLARLLRPRQLCRSKNQGGNGKANVFQGIVHTACPIKRPQNTSSGLSKTLPIMLGKCIGRTKISSMTPNSVAARRVCLRTLTPIPAAISADPVKYAQNTRHGIQGSTILATPGHADSAKIRQEAWAPPAASHPTGQSASLSSRSSFQSVSSMVDGFASSAPERREPAEASELLCSAENSCLERSRTPAFGMELARIKKFPPTARVSAK
jgi:hypothetical protein